MAGAGRHGAARVVTAIAGAGGLLRPAGRALFVGCLLLGGCTGGDASYLPFEPGAFWRYGLEVQTTDLRRTAKRVVVAMPAVERAGRSLYRLRVNRDRIEYFTRTQRGIERVAVQSAGDAAPAFGAEPLLVLPVPPVAGARWRQPTVTGVLEATVDPFRRKYRLQEPVTLEYVIEAVDAEVNVPAGRFRDCLRVRGTGHTTFPGDKTVFPSEIDVVQTDWYAPGVGLVRSHRVETTTSKVVPRGEYTLELEVFAR